MRVLVKDHSLTPEMKYAAALGFFMLMFAIVLLATVLAHNPDLEAVGKALLFSTVVALFPAYLFARVIYRYRKGMRERMWIEDGNQGFTVIQEGRNRHVDDSQVVRMELSYEQPEHVPDFPALSLILYSLWPTLSLPTVDHLALRWRAAGHEQRDLSRRGRSTGKLDPTVQSSIALRRR